MGRLKGCHDIRRVVGASVVHDDDLGGDRGGTDAGQRVGEKTSVVVARDHDGD
jgi:hypothetical protein